MRHTFLFARNEGLHGVTAAAVLTIGTESPSADSHDEALERFKLCVTDWVKETQEGREAWERFDDFNIGDVLNHDLWRNLQFAMITDRHGVVIHEMDSLAWDQMVPYDLRLADIPEEEEEA